MSRKINKMTMKSPTIDPQEVAKFSAMAAEWWDPTGKFKPLHLFNPIRIEYIRNIITQQVKKISEKQPLKGLSLVDIGCGGGLIAEPMCRLGAQVTAIDASEKNIATASTHANEQALNIEYHVTTAEVLAAEGKQYDIVLALEIVEHVADVEAFLKACAALAKPGGLLFVATLNRTFMSFAKAIIGVEYIMRWLPRGTHEWKKFLKPSEIATVLIKETCSIKEIKGFSYAPLTKTFSVSDDLSVNYIIVAQKQ